MTRLPAMAATCLLTLVLPIGAQSAATEVATAAGVQPPLTGTMYNGNNTKPPRLEASAQPTPNDRQNPPPPAGSNAQTETSGNVATGNSVNGSGGGNMSRTGGGN